MMKSPITWFVVIGILLFAADHLGQSEPVIVDDAVRLQIANLWEAQMGTPPDDAELKSLVNHWVREEIFYREAMRLGLDQDDTIVRRRLVQKLEFLAQEVDESAVTQADIASFYTSNLEEYTLPERYSFTQIFLSTEDSARELMARLNADDNWQNLGESTLLPRRMIRKSAREIASTFGSGFAEEIVGLTQATWRGPVKSTFGYHLIRLDDVVATEVTPLAYVERQVVADLLHKKREDSLEQYYMDLLQQHEVEYR